MAARPKSSRPKSAARPAAPPRRTKQRREELNPEQINDIKQAFDLFDQGGTGTIESKELKVALRALGFDPSKEDIEDLIHNENKEKDDRIDFHEFLNIIITKVSVKDDAEDIQKAFDNLDIDGNGVITKENLWSKIEELGEQWTEEEIEKMIRIAQKGAQDKKSKRPYEVTWEEFYDIMRG